LSAEERGFDAGHMNVRHKAEKAKSVVHHARLRGYVVSGKVDGQAESQRQC